ncbi:hypothetical protein IFM89_037390 [Coptis chinensis]|uniref:FRIGIDA-like protein n=1 Tax=Coptis chinensis TaxID=261450 RepID=A0A835IL00_9MAGN|nr:hypothetical protein IFM89_037390 [Coptis chinensis]
MLTTVYQYVMNIVSLYRRVCHVLRSEIGSAVGEAVDSPRLVLDVVKEYIDKEDAIKVELSDRRWACGMVISVLFPNEEKTMLVAGKIAKRALSVAEKWKAKIQTEESSGGVGHAKGPYVVLAQQIENETVKFAHYLGIKVMSIVGGQLIEEQGFKIRQGCEVVVATRGRLIDCLERRYAVLNQCNYVILDEADRMIDMGFEPQVVGVLDDMPSSNLKPENEDEELDEKRIYITTYMFSATMPPAVERLARKYLRNPVAVTIGTAGKATDIITQHVIMIKDSDKWPRLQKLLNDLNRVSNPFPNFHVTVKST